MNRRDIYAIAGTAALSLSAIFSVPTLYDSQPIKQTQLIPIQLTPVQDSASNMTLARLESILQEEASNVRGSNGQWQVTVQNRTLIVVADATNDRMRIFTPVVPTDSLSAQQIEAMLLANFHTALDARYALSEAAVVATFMHPLGDLSETYLRSALSQVATLADTFGSTYSSGEIGFGTGQQRNQSSPEQLRI
mgnify:CR=1 FL=1